VPCTVKRPAKNISCFQVVAT